MTTGIDLRRCSFRDALIVCAAVASTCALLYNDDMQHVARIQGLRIVNPFMN